MSPEVRTTDPEGVDYGWVMQVTFISTIFLGTPIVTVLSVFADLPTWPDRALFAVRIGALLWLVTLLLSYTYASRYREVDGEDEEATDESTATEDEDATDDSTPTEE